MFTKNLAQKGGVIKTIGKKFAMAFSVFNQKI